MEYNMKLNKPIFYIILGALIIIFYQVIGLGIYYFTDINLKWIAKALIELGIILMPISIFFIILLIIGLIFHKKQ